MTNKRIFHTDNEGRLVQTSVDLSSRLPGEEENVWLARMAVLLVPPGLGYAVRDISEFPALGGRFPDCWEMSGGSINISLVKAKQQRQRELLADRESRLVRVRRREQEAREDNQVGVASQLRDRVKALRQMDAQLDADLTTVVNLAGVEGLDAYQPTLFNQED